MKARQRAAPDLERREFEIEPEKMCLPCWSKGVDYLHHFDVEGLLPMVLKRDYQNRIELLQGTLDMLILKTLQWGEQHGYGISQAIRGEFRYILQVETGHALPRFASVGASKVGQG